MDFQGFAILFSEINGWALLSFGLVLILVDYLIIETEYISTFGFAAILCGLGNFFEYEPLIKIWTIPVFLVMSFMLNSVIAKKLTIKGVEYRTSASDWINEIVGAQGLVLVLNEEIDDGSMFYDYKKDIAVEKDADQERKYLTTYKFKDANGQIYPAKSSGKLVNLQEVEVVDSINGVLIIKGI
jgi:membrane-bound ClpP family serine protease